jgi:superfamily I DNA and/or RNA helicase
VLSTLDIEGVPLTPVVDAEEIGVIAPYKAQVRAIRELLKPVDLEDVSVGSVEQFQGQVRALALFSQVGGADFLLASSQERKVIIFATTRSNSEADKRRAMGFLQNRQRMNGKRPPSSILKLWAIADVYPR